MASIRGKGLTCWNNVHVADLARCFQLLVETAVKHNNNPELWVGRGYFFVENGEHQWGELSKEFGRQAANKGYIPGGCGSSSKARSCRDMLQLQDV